MRRGDRRISIPPGLGTIVRRWAAGLASRRPVHTPTPVASYAPVSAGSLLDALSPSGPGRKAYRVVFQDGTSLRINATRTRVYADLHPPTDLDAFRAASAHVRPGDRVLLAGGGTGWRGELLAHAVGPAGGVVSIDADRESVEYARKRYEGLCVSFELVTRGGPLPADPDAGFDAAIANASPRQTDDLWRVSKHLNAGGALVAICDAPHAEAILRDPTRPRSLAPASRTSVSGQEILVFRVDASSYDSHEEENLPE